ncbi:MAG: hypothetical protein A3K67_03460 [Euryarchaeota archaeon RBG_16_62_10]|nr:MAG: hypothetical protein A3K67_03460 [Euryarchaeota archaeon RBG_16_62_10]
MFVCDGQEISHRQMEALEALHLKGSMKRAAEALGLSTPVLYKYVKEVEGKADAKLVSSTSRGSRLTAEGLGLLRRYRAYELRLEDEKPLRVAGTAVSEKCVLMAATELSDRGTPCKVVIGGDEDNLRLMDELRVDCVVLDDAIFAIEKSPEAQSTEIGSDVLMHKDAGERYARLRFGAQRLAFRYLKERDIPHTIVRELFEPSMVDHTDLSYFVNRSLARTGVVRAEGAKEQRWSVHSIMALQCTEHEDLEDFLAEARDAWLYRKG